MVEIFNYLFGNKHSYGIHGNLYMLYICCPIRPAGILGHGGRVRSLRVGPPPPYGSSQGQVGHTPHSNPLISLLNTPIQPYPNLSVPSKAQLLKTIRLFAPLHLVFVWFGGKSGSRKSKTSESLRGNRGTGRD